MFYIAILFMSLSSLFSQTYDLFSDTYDYSLGEANISSSAVTIQNPASFADNQEYFLKVNYQYKKILGNLDLELVQEFSTDVYHHFLMVAGYKRFGIYYKLLKNHYQEDTQWTAPTYSAIEFHDKTSDNLFGIIYGTSVSRYFKLGIKVNHFLYYTSAIPENGKAIDVSSGLDVLPGRSLRISFVLVNILKSKMIYYVPDGFSGSIVFSTTQRRLDIGVSQQLKRITIYGAIKNALQEDIPHPNKAFLREFRTWHFGISNSLASYLTFNIGLKLERFNVPFLEDQTRRYFNMGLAWQFYQGFLLNFATSINNERSQNTILRNDGSFTESGKGNFLISISYGR